MNKLTVLFKNGKEINLEIKEEEIGVKSIGRLSMITPENYGQTYKIAINIAEVVAFYITPINPTSV